MLPLYDTRADLGVGALPMLRCITLIDDTTRYCRPCLVNARLEVPTPNSFETSDSPEPEAVTVPAPQLRRESAPSPEPRYPTSFNVDEAAINACALIEMFSQTCRFSESDLRAQLLDTAIENLLKIKRKMRQEAGDSGDSEPDVDSDMMVDAGCVVCLSEIADMVVLPCNHLALCGVRYKLLSSKFQC